MKRDANEKRILHSVVIPTAKILLAAGLVTWLVNSDKLDFRQLSVLTRSPFNLCAGIGSWVLSALLLGSWRWQILLKGIGIHIAYWRAVQLTMIGFFFNTTIPGAVGGDIVKAMYVIKDMRPESKTPAMLTIILDRITGLMGLFLLGGTAILFRFQYFLNQPQLLQLSIFILLVCVGILGFFFMLFRGQSRLLSNVSKSLSLKGGLLSLIHKIMMTLKTYSKNPTSILYAVLLSMCLQSIIALYFMFLTREINGFVVDIPTYAAIYPIAILITAIPLAPAGIGVGHVGFEKLYHIAGMENGANVFNVYVVTSILLNLSGAVPYLFFRRKKT